MLQLIAMITMLIDHVGLIFFPHSEMYRIIGRIAFPLYSWFLVQGYLHTSNLKRYIWRLFGLACLSQIPYTLALDGQVFQELNVIFTLLLSILGLYVMDRVANESLKAILMIGVLSAALLIPMDYGLYGVLLVFIYRYYDQWKMIGYHMTLNLMYIAIYGTGAWIQLFSLLGTFLFAYSIPYYSISMKKWIYRSFYPAHLAILFIVYLWMEQS
ncbi:MULTISPECIES: TraX family protein [unclassified Paenibacillus]|uniref:TraX family protein n=1 Tax=unclassified Paenibacillus TaxID=185978 RepID=UPI001B7B8245|nr:MULTISPECIES: TraX family protein [unclassified Paenibacillus]MBP1155691.1 hypothetical protein [Paenibacillus sp. PvP091]MBP1168923.1 hypothetical protein [Paenibacillus sp. PvR098]MBP2439951.1 hypothetical protein [Paenibacillus sp. PvP052]